MKKIIITNIDDSLLLEIENAIKDILANSLPKELHFEINGATGDARISFKIIDLIRRNGIKVTNYTTGECDVAGTLLSALGTKGFRTAKIGSKFMYKGIKEYSKDTTEDDLSPLDTEVLDAFRTITNKKNKAILLRIISAGKVSTKVAKQCGIIDKIDCLFEDFGTKGGKKKQSATSLAVPSAIISASIPPITASVNSSVATPVVAPVISSSTTTPVVTVETDNSNV